MPFLTSERRSNSGSSFSAMPLSFSQVRTSCRGLLKGGRMYGIRRRTPNAVVGYREMEGRQTSVVVPVMREGALFLPLHLLYFMWLNTAFMETE